MNEKIMIGAYADLELNARIERECSLDFGRKKAPMMLMLLNEALNAREKARNGKSA